MTVVRVGTIGRLSVRAKAKIYRLLNILRVGIIDLKLEERESLYNRKCWVTYSKGKDRDRVLKCGPINQYQKRNKMCFDTPQGEG